jgi:hypothetical protein
MATDRRFRLLKREISLGDLAAGGAAGDLLQYDGTNWTAATTLTGNYTLNGTVTIPEATVTAHEAAIDHDALLNFVAAEHLDWTGDQGASNIHVNNITAVPEAAVTAHEAALTILETQITDGSVLARIGATETISAGWTFSASPIINNAISVLGKNAAGSATARMIGADAADVIQVGDGTVFDVVVSSAGDIRLNAAGSEAVLIGTANGQTALYHDNALVARTAANGDGVGTGWQAKDAAGTQREMERVRVRSAHSNAGAHSHTLVLADHGKYLEKQGAGAFTLTIPPDSSVDFPEGTIIDVVRTTSSGTLTVSPGSGVTIRYRDGTGAASGTGSRTFSGTYIGMLVRLMKRNTDDWYALELTI